MKTTIKPRFITEKKSKLGKIYYEVEDVNGNKYTFHDKEIEDAITENFGKFIEVEVVESNGWKNIRGFYCVVEQSQTPEKVKSENKPTIQKANDIYDGYKQKTASMLTAYAKDFLVAKIQTEQDYKITLENVEAISKTICIIYKEILKNL